LAQKVASSCGLPLLVRARWKTMLFSENSISMIGAQPINSRPSDSIYNHERKYSL
jgi:hypothetical protein